MFRVKTTKGGEKCEEDKRVTGEFWKIGACSRQEEGEEAGVKRVGQCPTKGGEEGEKGKKNEKSSGLRTKAFLRKCRWNKGTVLRGKQKKLDKKKGGGLGIGQGRRNPIARRLAKPLKAARHSGNQG